MYHGQTCKLSLAHNEWLELNSKEFAFYPSVRTLKRMSRQGRFICLTQKAKHVVETLYLAGSISERIIHRSRMGSKGNCTLEKTLMGKVVCFFLVTRLTQLMLVEYLTANTCYHCNH
jgi:hypothetical protein